LVRSHAVEVAILTEKLNQSAKVNEQNVASIDTLTKQLEQATRTIEEQQAVVAFAKVAELDLVNRLRDLAVNTTAQVEAAENEKNRSIEAIKKAHENTLLELKTLKYRFQQVSKH